MATDALTKLIVLCCAFGYSLGFAAAMRSVIYVENFGLENLTNVYGLCSLFIGCGGFLGPMVGSLISDHFPNPVWTFLWGGSCMFAACLFMFFAPYVRRWEFGKKGPP